MLHCDQISRGGYSLTFDDSLTKPGTDSFLLSSFPALKKNMRVADLGSGIGIIGLLLLTRQPLLHIDNVEIMPEAFEVAQLNVKNNQLADTMSLHLADIRQLKTILPANEFDLVVSNPPYFKQGSGAAACGDIRQNARSEELCTMEQLFSAAARLLRWGGHFCLVHRPERLTDLLCCARAGKLEPKRIRYVCDSAEKAPSLVLLDCMLGGKSGILTMPPLILHDCDGRDSAELNQIYFRER